MSIYDQEKPSNFIKFTSGTVARIRLFGEPISFMQSFEGQEPKQRFASLCLYRNKEKKLNEIKILGFGWEIQKRLKAFVKDADWGDPKDYDVEITATGDGLAREYQVVPKPKVALNATETAQIESCDWNLEEMCKPKDAGAQTATPAGSVASAPAASEYDPFE